MTKPQFVRSMDTSIEAAEIRLLPLQQKKDFVRELLEEFGASKIRIRGMEMQHNCTLPFGGHTDNNSFAASINYEKLEFNCYVCHFAGPVTWWIAVNRGLDTYEVEPWLKKKLGIGSSLPLNDLLKVIDALHHPKVETKMMPSYPEKILDRWLCWNMPHPYLTDPPAEGGRGIPEENLRRFKIGYADYDEDFRYHERIIIPVHWDGKLVGWQARQLDPDDPDAHIKYKNSPYLPRDRVLWGEVNAKHIVLCESPMSVLRHIHHQPMVCTLGSKVTPEQLRLLERYERITILNENDKAGWSMIGKVAHHLRRKVRVDVCENPYVSEIDAGDMPDDIVDDLVKYPAPASIWTPKRYSELIPLAA